MNSLTTLTTLLGWCTAINIGVLLFTSLLLAVARGPVSRIHTAMFGLDQRDLSRAYFQYLAQYKIAVLMLNLVPYVALRLMA